MTNTYLFLLTGILIFSVSCSKPVNTEEETVESTTDASPFPTSEFESNEPKWTFTGTIQPKPEALTDIVLPHSAQIKRIYVHPGELVTKGQVLVRFSLPNLVSLQREYLEVKGAYQYAYEEYKRQGELSIEQAASLKTMQKAQASYLQLEARMNVLEFELRNLNVLPDSIAPSKLHATVAIYAPQFGTVLPIISESNVASITQVLFQIVNLNQLELHLQIPAEYWPVVSIGKTLEFWTAAASDSVQSATIIKRIPSVDATGYFTVLARPVKDFEEGIKGMPVFARIPEE